MGKPQPMRSYSFYDTSISCWNERGGFNDEDWQTYDAVRALMWDLGFSFHQDPQVKKHYRSIARFHHVGVRGDLHFEAKNSGRHIEYQFWQELVRGGNANGGRYDFNKLKLMPYLLRLQFMVVRQKIAAVLEAHGYVYTGRPTPRNATHAVQIHRRELMDFQGPHFYDKPPATYNATDADGVQLRDGMVRYFRSWSGHLLRGIVYHNINNMWWVVVNRDYYTNVAAFHLFTYDSARHPRRVPPSPKRSVTRMLEKAVAAQDFERAIPLRDRLRQLTTTQAQHE